MPEPEHTQDKTIVHEVKEQISPKYNIYYSIESPEDRKLQDRVRELRDQIFDSSMRASNSKRFFSEILKTPNELAEEGKYTFTQDQVTQYYNPEARQERRRKLNKGDLFEPPVVLGEIVPPAKREKREEGLHRADYTLHRAWDLVKDVITSGRQSPITTLARFAKAGEIFSDDDKRIISDEDWIGDDSLEEEEINRKLAAKMAEKLGINLEDLLEYHSRIYNKSSPTYLNKHDQHTVPSSQGGLSQRPIGIVSHWYEHMLVASDAGEALTILLREQDRCTYEDEEALDKLTELTFYAYQINSQAAELIRSAIPLGPNLSTKYIQKRRMELTEESKDIIENFENIYQNKRNIILSQNDKNNLCTLSDKIVKGRGTIKGEVSPDESFAVGKLKALVELTDRNYAIDRLNQALTDIASLSTDSSLNKEDLSHINSLLDYLNRSTNALYLSEISKSELEALYKLQDILDRDILIDIVVPEKIHGVRPNWESRLDLDKPADVIKVDPFGGSRLQIRKLLDVLEEPEFNKIFITGGPPRREDFNAAQLKEDGIDKKVYGDLRYVEIVEGLLTNELLDEYYKSIGVVDRKEMLELMFPKKDSEEPPSTLQNVDKAAEIVYKAISDQVKIATIGDCDQDGFFASVNWRWSLEHMGIKNIDQKFNTRLEGHSVQKIDLLNLALSGNELVIVNDTGSSPEDVGTFELIKEGAKSIDDLKFFRENIDLVYGFDKFSEHEQRQIKTKLTECINRFERLDIPIDIEKLRNTAFSTGKYIEDDKGNRIREYRFLKEFESLDRFLEGFEELKIIVCDHHTASIEGVEYLNNNDDIIMVNPEWIRDGYEDRFINEMYHALNPKEGEIDVELIDEIQRRYICYPESDIVGTVTASKVMKRVMQMFNDEKIVMAETSEYYKLPKAQRYEKYKETAEQIVGISIDKEEGDNKLPTSISLQLGLNTEVSLYIGDLWLSRNPREKIYSHIKHSVNSIISRLQYIEELSERKNISNEEAFRLLVDEFEESYNARVDKDNLYRIFQEETLLLTPKTVITRAITHIDSAYETRILQLLHDGSISESNLRFYLDYAGELEKSYLLMSRDEKNEYIKAKVLKFAEELEQNTADHLEIDINIVDIVKEISDKNILAYGFYDLRDLKRIYYEELRDAYKNKIDTKIYNKDGTLTKIGKRIGSRGNRVWKSTMEDIEEMGILSPIEVRNLQNYFEYGPYGLEFFDFVQAVATLGDAGSVGPDRGIENRWLVRKGMDELENFVNDFWEAEDRDKQLLDRVMPEIIRMVRISLRGTNIRSVNWHQSRLLTHAISAFVNAAYRRAKEGREGRAKDFWKEMSDVVVKRSEDENIRRHRHTLPQAQEETIEIRQRMLNESIKELTDEEEKLDHPIIIVELQGEDFVDPVKGLRGLIAGELASRFKKPAMVIVKEKNGKKNAHATYSVSFRLPGKGNVATDMVQLKLAMKNDTEDDIRILGHGGHPQASGGTWEVRGGIERLHEVLDPIFSEYTEIDPDRGIIDIEKLVEEKAENLKDDGWEDIDEFNKHINVFSIADTLATQTFNLFNPYGIGFRELLLKFKDLTVVDISKGCKNDGNEYVSLQVRDKRGNTKFVRSFEELERFANINEGDKIDVIVQPIARLRSLSAGNMVYRWPNPYDPKRVMEISTITGEKSKPHLDVREVENIRRYQN
jgi:single-stranded DNA-specific DHH superfamily exonuclease